MALKTVDMGSEPQTKAQREAVQHIDAMTNMLHNYLNGTELKGFKIGVKFLWEGFDEENEMDTRVRGELVLG